MCCNWLTGTPHNGMPSILFVFFFRTRLTTAQLIGQTKKPTLRQLEKPVLMTKKPSYLHTGECPSRRCVSGWRKGVPSDGHRWVTWVRLYTLWLLMEHTGLPQRLEILGSYFFRVDRYRWDEEEIQLYLVVGTNTTTTTIHFHLVYLVTFPSITGI